MGRREDLHLNLSSSLQTTPGNSEDESHSELRPTPYSTVRSNYRRKLITLSFDFFVFYPARLSMIQLESEASPVRFN